MSDIKALHHIHNGYNFAKEPFRREIARSFSGQGVTWANGEVSQPIETNGMLTEHQAKPTSVKGGSYNPPSESPRPELCYPSSEVASNASVPPLRVLGDVLSLPQVTTKWNDILAGAPESQEVLNVNDWLTRVALDAIGEGESRLTVASCY